MAIPGNPTYKIERDIVQPYPDEIEYLKELAEKVAGREADALAVARCAIYTGFMLIGTTVSKPVHHPTDIENHYYTDLRDEKKRKLLVPEDQPLLRVSKNADIAILSGLFGNLNSREEIEERSGKYIDHYGWGNDIYKTYREGILEQEEMHVRDHAQPRLIRAATNPRAPFTGYIDFVLDDANYTRVQHDIAQFVTTVPRETIFTLPLNGAYDLPLDIIPSRYTPKELDRQAVVVNGDNPI